MAEFRGGTTAEHAFAEHERRDLAPWIELHGHLFALEALLRARIEREERLLIPLLETAVDEAATGGRSQ
ncbi:MAG: hypothetical protein WEG56_07085 [Chloroflexota bacterium]